MAPMQRPWIQVIPPQRAEGKLAQLYQRVADGDGDVDNILQVHSLRPHSLSGHLALYKNVLHHSGNTLPKTELELIGVWVSHLNGCAYCVEHHFAGYQRLLGDDTLAVGQRSALESGSWEADFDSRWQAMLRYAESLTRDPAAVEQAMVQALRTAGLDDGQILELNQVVAYFNYANRTVLGLGVSTVGDELGLSPNDSSDEQNWSHS